MFWEADTGTASSGLRPVLTDSLPDAEPKAAADDPGEAPGRACVEAEPAPAGCVESPGHSRDPTLDRLGASLPPWALEPDWTNAPMPAPRRSRRIPVMGSAAALVAIVLGTGAVALGGGHRPSKSAHLSTPATLSSAHGARAPIVLSSFSASEPRSTRGHGHIMAVRPHRTRSHVPHRHRRAAHPNGRRAARPAARKATAASAKTVRRSAPATSAPTASAPAEQASRATSPPANPPASSSPAPASPPASSVPSSPASASPPPSSSPAPDPQSSGSSEFNFEQ